MQTPASDPTRTELEEQFKFYDSRANRYGFISQLIDYVNAISASSAAILGIFTSVPAIVPGLLAAVVAVLAIVSQVSHPQREWIRTRRAAELLRRERTLYDAPAEEYAKAGDPRALLALRIESIRSEEFAEFLSATGKTDRAKPTGKGK